MDILELIKSRRAIREYQNKPVPKELLNQIVEAGIWAPSSMNRQPWKLVVVTDEKALQALRKEAKLSLIAYLNTDEAKAKYGAAIKRFMPRAEGEDDELLYNAPCVIFVVQAIDVGDEFDFGLCAQNVMLAAHSLGLATCPIGLAAPMNNSKEARKILKLKPEEKLIIALTLGYPAEKAEPHERRADTVTWVA